MDSKKSVEENITKTPKEYDLGGVNICPKKSKKSIRFF